MALSDLTRREILLATEEHDRLGRDAFLDTYGFAPARSYLLLLNGRAYDSKAIVGVAHGYLPGQRPLAANDFSGGAATVGRLLRGLGFEVTASPGPADPPPSLTISALLDSLARLRPYRSPTGRQALYQPLTLVWAIGRARRGLDRITPWSETQDALGGFLERHGEYPRPHYPLAALYHAGLWEIDGPRPVPPAHRNAPMHWFADHRPQSGLTAPCYNLVRYSGEARVAVVEAIVDRYLTETDTDWDAILTDAGLADAGIADDQAPAGDQTGVTLSASPVEEEYRRLCAIADRMRERGATLSQARVTVDLMRSQSARRAVLGRSEGHCENPGCTGDPQDITDAGLPILEVDHIHDLALGGPDHPGQMIALCPNCHQIKTRGSTREKLRQELLTVARQRHNAILARSAR